LKDFIEIIGDLLIIGCGLAFLYIFGSILFYGNYWAGESNQLILNIEIIMALLIIIIGLERYIDDLKR